MFHTLTRYGLAVLLLPAAAIAGASGFDCAAARTGAEKMICQDSSLSRLDAQLNEVYAQFRKTERGRAEKPLQLAWLKKREACADEACLRRAYEARIAELQARLAGKSTLIGFWKKEYSCEGATGIYEDRCRQGERDVFRLDIMVDRDRVCVSHVATAQLGNRVDGGIDGAPSMTGALRDHVATVRYRSRWGGTGSAHIRVEGDKLVWKVVAKNKGESWIPDEEVLVRVPAGPHDRVPACKG